jgi:ATP-dependent Clp protease ATP-binding subunit ClpA
MFEKFTKEARSIVTVAVTEAERRGSPRVGTEHLLVAAVGASPPFDLSALGPLNVGAEGIRDQLDRMDSASLASVGFDPDLLPPALRRAEGADQSKAIRHLPFTHGAKDVLVGSLRQAVDRGDRRIGVEHILLSLLAVPAEDPVASVLAYLGADPAEIRADIEAALRRAS